MNYSLYMEGLAMQIVPFGKLAPIETTSLGWRPPMVQLLLTWAIFVILLRKPSNINLYIAFLTILVAFIIESSDLCPMGTHTSTNMQSIDSSRGIMDIWKVLVPRGAPTPCIWSIDELNTKQNTMSPFWVSGPHRGQYVVEGSKTRESSSSLRPGALTSCIILLSLMGLCSLVSPGPDLALFLIVGLGGLLIVNSVDYLSIYLALEFQTLALFILTAYGAPLLAQGASSRTNEEGLRRRPESWVPAGLAPDNPVVGSRGQSLPASSGGPTNLGPMGTKGGSVAVDTIDLPGGRPAGSRRMSAPYGPQNELSSNRRFSPLWGEGDLRTSDAHSFGPGLVHCAEGGLKYWILGAMSSGFYLFGCALYFGAAGAESGLGTIYPGITAYLCDPKDPTGPLGGPQQDLWAGSLGYLFILVSFLFKLGVAPFHMWTPDVYEGAPTSTTALIAIIPKYSIFIIIIGLAFSTTKLLFLVAVASLLIGAFGALNQTRIKRLLAYSGIGHMGFILIGLSIGSYDSFQNSFIYILIYLLTILASFTILCSLEELLKKRNQNIDRFISLCQGSPHSPFKDSLLRRHKRVAGLIIDFSLFSRGYPYLSFSIAILFLSLAGIPPLLGFMGKWLILVGSIKTANTFFLPIYYWGSVIAGICATLSAFYYIRIVATLYFTRPRVSSPMDKPGTTLSVWDPLSFLFLWESILSPIPPFPWSRSVLIGLYLYFILFLIFTPQSLFLLSHEAILGIV